MKIVKKVKILPNKSQKEKINFWIRRCNYLYNVALQQKIDCYKKGIIIRESDQRKELVDIKNYDSSWKEVPNKCLSNTIFQLDDAFQKFFKRGCKGFPRFQGKDNFKSIEFVGTDIRIIDDKLFIPKIKENVKYSSKDILPVSYTGVRLKKEKNSYFLCFITEFQETDFVDNKQVIGIDLGLKTLWTDSNGKKVNRFSTKLVKKYEKRVKLLNQSLSTKKKNSIKFKKVKKHLNKTYDRLKNSTKDYFHKETTKFIKQTVESTIVIGDLQIRELKKKENQENKNIRRSYQTSSIGLVKILLSYKSKKFGKVYQLVNEAYTSKTCSCCGTIKSDLKVVDRTFECINPNCKNIIDRDHNGAINIKNVWLGQFKPIGKINKKLLNLNSFKAF